MKGIVFKDVTAYINGQPESMQPLLKQFRNIIKSVVPEAEEIISYRIPTYKYHGVLVGFGTHKEGCSFYVMNPRILAASFATELEGYEYTGSTIHFDPEAKLPATLIKKIIKHRMQENTGENIFKKAKKK